MDNESDERLKDWAVKQDKTKGELTVQKFVDELYDWTARRMADAKDNNSKADEILLKRCAYHGLNLSAPFIVMRCFNLTSDAAGRSKTRRLMEDHLIEKVSDCRKNGTEITLFRKTGIMIILSIVPLCHCAK